MTDKETFVKFIILIYSNTNIIITTSYTFNTKMVIYPFYNIHLKKACEGGEVKVVV
jgi:hypothetical protein